MAHFHYQRGDAFGDGVCSYARYGNGHSLHSSLCYPLIVSYGVCPRLRGAQAAVTGRRTNISNARR
jgi:hypothetical protein